MVEGINLDRHARALGLLVLLLDVECDSLLCLCSAGSAGGGSKGV